MAALSWNYPQDELMAIERAAADAEAQHPVTGGLALDNLNFDYRISGDDPSWRPLRAFDDGRQTFIAFPASISVGEAPPLFVTGANGEAQLVNYRMRGDYYVVDRLFDAAELRLGEKHQDIVRITRGGKKLRRNKERRPGTPNLKFPVTTKNPVRLRNAILKASCCADGQRRSPGLSAGQ
jgi:type IV secretion system protein TrbG